MISKLLIANRGEIACRIMRTCREMGIATVAIFSDVDRDALHVQMADEAIHLGSAAAQESYLHIEKIIKAAQRAGADAVHPGYGFLAENASFAQAVIDSDLLWVGPAPETIALMGDKATAKQHLNDVPYVPGYVGEDQDDATLIEAAEAIGFPIMIKATAGGGGKGMRAVHTLDEIPQALAAARREAQQAFGDETLMLEKLIQDPRHIEVQIMGDHHGHVMALGERECSIQRRHQKIIEESPAYGLDPALRQQIQQTAIAIGRQLDYRNAGTVEFLVDAGDNFYFMEMNTRLQVEHPVTEAVYAIDLVRWQLNIAEGVPLTHLLPPYADVEDFAYAPDGHAIEVRIYAEDPSNGFLPVTGDVLRWQAPDSVRIDTGIQSGDAISPYYDPMVAKVIAHGADRLVAIRKLADSLRRLQLMGMRNNIAFLQRVLLHPAHLEGNLSTRFLEEHGNLMHEEPVSPTTGVIAAAFAKGGMYQAWRNNRNRPIRHRFRSGDLTFEVLISQIWTDYRVAIDDETYHVSIERADAPEMTLAIDGHVQRFTVIEGANDQWWVHSLAGTFMLLWQTPLPIAGIQHIDAGSLRAPMPGQVISVDVEIGQTVKAGTLLLVMEAMKMEHRITAPQAGTIERIAYEVGDTVQQDDVLIDISTSEAT